jgi:hypothetical protein
LQEPQRIEEIRFSTSVGANEQIKVAELEVDALQALEIAYFEFGDHDRGLGVSFTCPVGCSLVPGFLKSV